VPSPMTLASNGIFSGTPTTAGPYNLTITATNACGAQTIFPFQWTVASSSLGPGITVSVGSVQHVGTVKK
jgi:hypothetical protein